MPIKRKINLDSTYRQNINPKMKQKTISEFLNNEYKEYSLAVISERCCPSIWDGFRLGARKLLHAAFKGGLKDGSEKKVPTLIGDCYVHSLYQHGDASLASTIVTMARYFLDNLNTLTGVGAYGTLREDSCSASRYLFCKLSKYSKLYKVDEDLLEYVFDEGEYLEPTHYLPIIPTLLCRRSDGMAPGYRFSSFSYNPIDIIDACIEVIKTGKVKIDIRPYVREINSENFVKDTETGRWWNIGHYNVDLRNDILQINDLPYDVTYDKFEKKMYNYIENGYIKDMKNFSHDDIIDYRILFNKSKLAREMEADRKEATIKKFMLQTIVPEDLLYVLDENNKVKHFANKEDLIIYFVNLRLNKYNERKNKLVSVKEQQLKDNTELCKFIELVTSGKLKINNRKISEVKEDLKLYNLSEKLLQIQISKLTQEEKEAILLHNKEIEDELVYIKNTTIEQMYLNDLKDLRKEINNDFN